MYEQYFQFRKIVTLSRGKAWIKADKIVKRVH
jgi:hypothetical protein